MRYKTLGFNWLCNHYLSYQSLLNYDAEVASNSPTISYRRRWR